MCASRRVATTLPTKRSTSEAGQCACAYGHKWLVRKLSAPSFLVEPYARIKPPYALPRAKLGNLQLTNSTASTHTTDRLPHRLNL
jgi:hypothetical protein